MDDEFGSASRDFGNVRELIIGPGFDGVNEEANVRSNAAVVHGYANVRASAVMTDDNNDNVDDGNFDDTLSEMIGTSSRVATSPAADLDLAFGAVDVNVDLACTSLLSPLSHLPPPISSPPSSAASWEQHPRPVNLSWAARLA